MIKNLVDTESFHELVSNEGIVLVDFYAGWCEPCKWLDVILTDISSQLPTDCSILKVDSEKFTDLSLTFSVRSVPVLILFKSGKEVWRMNGFLMGPDLLSTIRSFL